MSIQANKTVVGAFVLGALGLLVGAILLLGSGRLFRTPDAYVLYFDGSVKGLNLGAPVVFRGVEVGSVTKITLIGDPRTLSFIIPVEVEIDRSKILVPEEWRKSVNRGEMVSKLIENGLRAQLGLQSFVTGQLMIELDLHPGSELRMRGKSHEREVPTLASPMDKLSRTLQNIPIEQIMGQVLQAVEGLNKVINSPVLANTATELNGTLRELQVLARGINTQVTPVGNSLEKAMTSISGAAASAERVLKHADNVVAPDSQTMTDLRKAINELSNAARALRIMADYMERHPEALIKGKGEYR